MNSAFPQSNQGLLPRAVVGLGANLGQPLNSLRQATALLAELAEVVAVSSVYRTAPQGLVQQPHFLNAAVCIRWPWSPARLVVDLLSLERKLGRRRFARGGPRTIDLDLLWVEGVELARRDATLPHPRLLRRAFALVPLCEVAPDAREPRSGRPYASLCGDLRGQSLYRVADGCGLPSMDTKPTGW